MADEQQTSVIHRRRKPINKKTKLNIVFDEAARREFLVGFHKRKLQRKKVALEQFERQLKAEKKRIKQQSREHHRKLLRTYKTIPVLEEQLAKKFSVENTVVSVLELDSDLLAQTNFLIGNNKARYEEPVLKKETREESKNNDINVDELPGMELKTKKEIQKELKLQAWKQVKKSKVFKQKENMERIKQKKIAMKQRNNKRKALKVLEKRNPRLKKRRK